MSHNMDEIAENIKMRQTISQLKAEVSQTFNNLISSFMEQVTEECPPISKSRTEVWPESMYCPVLNYWIGVPELQDEFPWLGANIY